jgi:hypothetical protein
MKNLPEWLLKSTDVFDHVCCFSYNNKQALRSNRSKLPRTIIFVPKSWSASSNDVMEDLEENSIIDHRQDVEHFDEKCFPRCMQSDLTMSRSECVQSQHHFLDATYPCHRHHRERENHSAENVLMKSNQLLKNSMQEQGKDLQISTSFHHVHTADGFDDVPLSVITM